MGKSQLYLFLWHPHVGWGLLWVLKALILSVPIRSIAVMGGRCGLACSELLQLIPKRI